jgi:hypothetical protein
MGSTILNGIMGASWGNIGNFIGTIGIIDSRTTSLDFVFLPPPITTLEIDETNQIILANTVTGVSLSYHYMVGL